MHNIDPSDAAINRPSTSRAITEAFTTPPPIGAPLAMLEQSNDAPSITHALANEVFIFI